MAPHVIDLRAADDSRDVVHRAVQALAEGKVVAFPTETVYGLAVSGLCESAVERLAAISAGGDAHPLSLAVKSGDDALDYVPDLSPLGQRLARRCWPGPVTLLVKDQHPESLIKQLSPQVQNAVSSGGLVSLRVPAHQAIQGVLRLLAGPLVLANARRRDQGDAVTAQDVVETHDGQVMLVLDDGRSRFAQPSSIVHVRNGGYDVLRVGVVSEQTLKRLSSVIVLFVCTGNTCRSPMAEGMFRQRVAKKLGCRPDQVEDRGVIVLSAGIAAMMGGRATREAVEVMNEMGIDLSAHESQPLTEQLVRHADLMLTMTRSHRQAILAEWPEVAERTKLLSHDGMDVADPVGGPTEMYRKCAQQVGAELDAWIEELPL